MELLAREDVNLEVVGGALTGAAAVELARTLPVDVILLDLPDYATLDKLEADEGTRALGHRAGEWIFERHHSMFLRERMGPDLEYHP